MDRKAYDTKVTTTLSDPATYKPVTMTPFLPKYSPLSHWQSLLIAGVQLLLSSWPLPSPTLQPLQTKLVEDYAHSPLSANRYGIINDVNRCMTYQLPAILCSNKVPMFRSCFLPDLSQTFCLLAISLSLWFTLYNGSICLVSRSHSLSLSRRNKCLSLSPCCITCSIAHNFSTTASNLTIWLKIHDNLPRRRQFPFECLCPCPGCSQLLPQLPNLRAIFACHA